MAKFLDSNGLLYVWGKIKAGFVAKESGKGLSTNDFTTTLKNKLDGIAEGANKTIVDSSLNATSVNPVQNKIIKTELDKKLSTTTADSTYAKKSDITGLYKYMGSVANEAGLPTTGQKKGDVWDIKAASKYGPAGTNVVWDGAAWDSLGGAFQIDPITNTEIDTICK